MIKLSSNGYKIRHNKDKILICPIGEDPEGTVKYRRSKPTGKVKQVLQAFKAGAEMTTDEISDMISSNDNRCTHMVIYNVRKWLKKENLYLGQNAERKYHILTKHTISRDANRRYKLIVEHFNNVQDLIVNGVKTYYDNPEVLSELENLMLNIQQIHITHKRALLNGQHHSELSSEENNRDNT